MEEKEIEVIKITPSFYIYFGDGTKLRVKAQDIQEALIKAQEWAKENKLDYRVINIYEN